MATTQRPIGRWIVLGLWCALLFVVPSALLIDRGAPTWAAAAIGALSFPIAPIGWHVVAERARKRRAAAAKVAPKATLTPGDRYVMRTIAVALVTCVPWFVVARGRTLRAVWHHAAWPIDAITSAIRGDGGGGGGGGARIAADQRLLQYVPGDAEAIMWIRSAPELESLLGPDRPSTTATDLGFVQGVVGAKDGEVFVVVVMKDAASLDRMMSSQINQDLAKRWLGHELHFTTHRIAPDTIVGVTAGWDDAYAARVAGKTPAAKALIDRIGTITDDTFLIAVGLPRGPLAGLTLRDARTTLRVEAITRKLAATVTIHVADAASSNAVAEIAKHWVAQGKARLPAACRDSVGKILDGIAVRTKGDEVSIDTRVAPDQIMPAMLCAISAR